MSEVEQKALEILGKFLAELREVCPLEELGRGTPFARKAAATEPGRPDMPRVRAVGDLVIIEPPLRPLETVEWWTATPEQAAFLAETINRAIRDAAAAEREEILRMAEQREETAGWTMADDARWAGFIEAVRKRGEEK